jgi:translation initiation factor IF-3
VRVLDESGENLGVFPIEKALSLAEEKGVDLVLISPNAKPPVARAINYDKYRYTKEKELKKQKQYKAPETKRVQISVRSAKNDLLIRLNQLEKFIKAGHPVEIQLVLRGREKGNMAWAREKLKEFIGMISIPYKTVGDIKTGGRGLIFQIAPE